MANMKSTCVLCTKVEDEELLRNLIDVSSIFFNLTSLEISHLEVSASLKLCTVCYETLLRYDSFRTVCLEAYAERIQHERFEAIFSHSECDVVEKCSVNETEEEVAVNIIKTESNINLYATCVIDDLAEKEPEETLLFTHDRSERNGDATSSTIVHQTRGRRKKRTDETQEQSRLQTKNQPKELCCQLCSKKFRTQSRFDGHIRAHQGLKPALCKFCDKEFADWRNLKRHVINKHSNRDRKTYTCDFDGCNLQYATKQGMLIHRKKHDPIYVTSVPKQSVCELCGKMFSTKGALKKHSYIHTGNMPFRCEMCGKKLPTAHKLKVHTMRHLGIKNFECPHCGLKKTTIDELKVHINYHTKEKQFPCDTCDLVFSNSGNLTRHVRIVHRGIKDFKCPHCERSFGKSETLKNHIMTHTGEKPHECGVCFKRFIQLIALQNHTKVHAECKDGLKKPISIRRGVLKI